MFQPGGPLLGVGWDEVFDVGGDQCACGGRCAGEDLVVRHASQGGICHGCEHVVGLAAELLGYGVAEHLIEQQRDAHWLPGAQIVFAAPSLLRCVLGGDPAVGSPGSGVGPAIAILL